MKTPKQILKDARTLVENGWTQRTSARRVDGSQCSPWADDAASFCSSGAISRAGGDYFCNEAHALGLLKQFLPEGFHFIQSWNDDPKRTQAEVLALFDQAIEAAYP